MPDSAHLAPTETPEAATARRVRPKPGERRMQILQALAVMLERSGNERITTAALSRQLGLSEAALYRHFASKAQMFEGLIDFIEGSVFTLVNQITAREGHNAQAAAHIVTMLLRFGERNRGMVRVMVGNALAFENERLMQRMTLFFDKVESALRQCLRPVAQAAGVVAPMTEARVLSAALVDVVCGRLQRYERSNFRRLPTENLDATLGLLL